VLLASRLTPSCFWTIQTLLFSVLNGHFLASTLSNLQAVSAWLVGLDKWQQANNNNNTTYCRQMTLLNVVADIAA